MERWTNWVIAHRKRLLVAWLVLFLLGGAATANLGSLLSNRFSVPGSDSQRGFDLLRQHFHERGDGAFTLVAVGDARSPRVRAEVAAAAQRRAGGQGR
ncbi:MAG: hypothetical protein JWN32_2230 [Solirubrobacterales bacterium]|jgi:RND superfamily putative drug exporter|nr:hypothetical protein [Solirubrobacterales bacterium]